MKRWRVMCDVVVMGVILTLLGTAQAGQKPLKQPQMLHSDKAVSISPSMLEEVYTKGMVLHASGKTQLWFDDRVTRQKHWGSMWVWPLKPGQKLCVRALALPASDGLALHPFLKHAALTWPSAPSAETPVCFEYPQPGNTKQPDDTQIESSPMQKAIQTHWVMDDLATLKARQQAIFDKIPTIGPGWFRKKHKITRHASSPDDPSLRWVVLHYPLASTHKDILANKLWHITYHTKAPRRVDLPIGLSMGMWLGALWHVYGDVTHQWLNASRPDSQPVYGRATDHAIKYDNTSADEGGAFIDRAFRGTRRLAQRVLVSDLGWRAIHKKVKAHDKRFGGWAAMKPGGVWGRFYVMPSLSHLKCVPEHQYWARKGKAKHHCQTYLTPGSLLTTTSPYALEFAQNAPVIYERGFMMRSRDFHQPPELKWLPRKHLGVGEAPKVDKPKPKEKASGCHTVPLHPGEVGLYVVAVLAILVVRRQRRWPVVGMLVLVILLLSSIALARKRRLPRVPDKTSKTLTTPFVPVLESSEDKKQKDDPRCRRYVTLDMDGQTHKLSTWELLCVPFGKPLSKIYTQVLALPPSRYTMGKDLKDLPTTSKRPLVTSLEATMESTEEVNWMKFVGKRLPTSFTYRLKDYRLFVPQRGASACSFARRMKQKDVLLKLKQYESLCQMGWHIVVATYERYRRNLGVQGKHRGGSFVILPGLDVTLRFERAASSLDISPDSLPGVSHASEVVINSHVMLSPEVFKPCFRVEKTSASFKPSKVRNTYRRVEMEYHLTSKPCGATSRGFALSPKSR